MESDSRWFSSVQFIRESQKWLMAIDRRENLAVQFFPKTDRARRLDQFLYDTRLQTRTLHHKTAFQPIDLSIVDDIQDLKDTITRQLNNSPIRRGILEFDGWLQYIRDKHIHLVLIVSEAEVLLTPHGRLIQSLLATLTTKYERDITVMSCYEADITHPTNTQFLPSATNLFANIFTYPLYDANDTLSLARYLADRWQVQFGKQKEKRLLKDCGGHLWLTAEAIRELTLGQRTWSFENEGMQFRMQTIAEALSDTERAVFLKLANDPKAILTDYEMKSLEYFKKMNLYDAANGCLVGYLPEFISRSERPTVHLKLKGPHILLNDVPVSSVFSKKELRIMKLLLEHRQTVVTRDQIAKELWPADTEEHYSDWAIDQIIARIRKRLGKLLLPPSLLQSVRGQGYMLTLKPL